MSELLVSELDDAWVDTGSVEAEVVDGAEVVVESGASLVVDADSSLVVVTAASELVVDAELGSCGASDVEVGTGLRCGQLKLKPVWVPTKAECDDSALLLEADWVALATSVSVELCDRTAHET